MRIFVYGTLKKGFRNHLLLEGLNVKSLGKYQTLEKYTMFSIKRFFPGVIEGGNTSILGEVYELDSLVELDRLEGYYHKNPRQPDYVRNHYIRKLINTDYGEAWIYLYNQPISFLDKQLNGVW